MSAVERRIITQLDKLDTRLGSLEQQQHGTNQYLMNQAELLKEQGQVLKQHEQRSTSLEKIVKPLVAVHALYQAVIVLGGLAGALYAIVQLLGRV